MTIAVDWDVKHQTEQTNISPEPVGQSSSNLMCGIVSFETGWMPTFVTMATKRSQDF